MASIWPSSHILGFLLEAMNDPHIEQIVDRMVELAESRKKPDDPVSRLYQIELEVVSRIGEVMRQWREEEREG